MTRTEIAWAAGFFDGEGCFQWINKATHPSTQAQIGQTDPRALRRFRAAIGCGQINGPYRRPNPKHASMWIWVVSAIADFKRVVGTLWPFLGPVKRQQARKVLQRYRQYQKKLVTNRRLRRQSRAETPTGGQQ